MKRLAFGLLFALSATAQAGVSLVAETPDAAPTSSAGPATPAPTLAAQPGKPLEKPFDKANESDTVTIDAEADPHCDFNPPHAALIAARYPDYHADRAGSDDRNRSPGDLIETATLADGTRVRVLSYGCVDSFGHTFTFTYAKPAHAAKELAFWAQQAHTTLAALALSEHVIGLKDLNEFLARAGTLKRHGNKIVQCQNGTQPADDTCDWYSHGGIALGVERRGETIEVTLGVDYSG